MAQSNQLERAFWNAVEDLGVAARSLSASAREAVGRSFADDAQAEHASIASFNRFSLHLLAVGAPAELVERAQQAALDEVHHARICYAIASQYLGQPLGPAAIDLSGDLLGELTLSAIAAAAVLEGCVGETLAALEAEASREAAVHPALAAAWGIISRDEAAHAELAWTFVGWALHQGSAEVRHAVERSFETALRDVVSASTLTAIVDPLLQASGRLGAHARSELRRRAVRETLEPAVVQLLR